MHLVRDDLDAEDLAALERQFPGLTARVATLRSASGMRQDNPVGGVQLLHPADGMPVDNVTDGCGPCTSWARRGAMTAATGVQPAHERVQQLHPNRP